jgi:hypothetical protein
MGDASVGNRAEVIRKRAHKKLSQLQFKTNINESIFEEKLSTSVGTTGDKEISGGLLNAEVNSRTLHLPELPRGIASYECVFDNVSGYPSQKLIAERSVLSVLSPSKKLLVNAKPREVEEEGKKCADDLRRLPKVIVERVRIKKKRMICGSESRNDSSLEEDLCNDDEEEVEEMRERHIWETLSESDKALLFR